MPIQLHDRTGKIERSGDHTATWRLDWVTRDQPAVKIWRQNVREGVRRPVTPMRCVGRTT